MMMDRRCSLWPYASVPDERGGAGRYHATLSSNELNEI